MAERVLLALLALQLLKLDSAVNPAVAPTLGLIAVQSNFATVYASGAKSLGSSEIDAPLQLKTDELLAVEPRDRPFQQLVAAPDHRPEFYVGGQARDAAAAAMGAGSPTAGTPARGPTFITDNPLRNLPPLPKAHHSCQGIDGAYLAHNSAVNPKGTNTSNPPAPRKLSNATGALPPPHPGAPLDGVVAPATVSLEMLVDFARIMGSFPCLGTDPERMELVVQILLNASALHPQQRLGHLYVGGSPYINRHSGASNILNTTGDNEEAAHYLSHFQNTSKALAAANAKFGSNVKVEMAMFDIEAFGVSATWFGSDGKALPEKQPVFKALANKYELIANVTRQVFPGIALHFDDYGAAWWQPTGTTGGCYNIQPKNGSKVCSSNSPDVGCPDGWCTDLSFSFEESFSHDENFAFAVDLYQPWDPHLTQVKFAKTAAAATAHGLGTRQNVYPVISLGASYTRNHSHYPDINGMAKETLRGFPFFDIMSFDFTGDDGGAPGGGYDLAFSMLLGAQVNSPKLGSSTRFSALGPWEQSMGATFFPGVLDLRASPSKTTGEDQWNPKGVSSTKIVDHFIAYVEGATTPIEVGPFG